jgi:hypothetical protein
MVSAAQKYKNTHVEFRVSDVRQLESRLQDGTVEGLGSWDKVVSNAALHWILKDPSTRVSVIRAAHLALAPNGHFIFEMGGHGNVAEVHAALISAIHHAGVPLASARAASPWFFPSEVWMRTVMQDVGFEVVTLETEYRPTKLTEEEGGGLEGWVRLMGAEVLETVGEGTRERVVREVCGVLEGIVEREEGGMYLGYMRLRGVGRKR